MRTSPPPSRSCPGACLAEPGPHQRYEGRGSSVRTYLSPWAVRAEHWCHGPKCVIAFVGSLNGLCHLIRKQNCSPKMQPHTVFIYVCSTQSHIVPGIAEMCVGGGGSYVKGSKEMRAQCWKPTVLFVVTFFPHASGKFNKGKIPFFPVTAAVCEELHNTPETITQHRYTSLLVQKLHTMRGIERKRILERVLILKLMVLIT